MKVFLYFEGINGLLKSGIGKAFSHQKKALELNNIKFTTNENDNYDILHINTIFYKSPFIIKKARKKGAKIIYHAHTTIEDYKNAYIFAQISAPFVKFWLVKMYKQADMIITPSLFSKAMLVKYGVKCPIHVISNGIDVDKFKKDDVKAKKFREYFKLADDKKVIISAGLWFRRKGLIDFCEVAKKMPDVTFIWFGSTSLLSIPHEVRKTVKNPPANVIFPGYMSGDIFQGAFTGANAFFFPSYVETEGIVTLEAVASEQAVVVRDIPVYEGWLDDKVSCLKGKSNEEFVELLNDVITNDYTEMRKNARKVAEERSLDKIGAKIANVYKEVLDK